MIRRLLLCLLLTALAATSAEAAKRKVRVGFFRYAGCHQVDNSGRRSGYGYDFYEKLAKFANWDIEYVGYDKAWEDMLPMLERGEIDVVDFVEPTPERAEKFLYSKRPMAYSSTTLRTTRAKVDGYRDVEADSWPYLKVGVLKNETSEDRFVEFANDHHLEYGFVYFPREDMAAEACRKGEIDMVAFDAFAMHTGLDTVCELARVRNHLVVRKSDRELAAEIDNAMVKLSRSEPTWMAMIRGRYYPLTEITAYIPDTAGEPLSRYMRRLLAKMSEVRGWDVTVKFCHGDFNDVEDSRHSLVCGAIQSVSDFSKLQVPQQSAGRYRADLYARPDEHRFDGGVAKSRMLLRVGYLASEQFASNLFSGYSSENGLSYQLSTATSAGALEQMLNAGLVDLIIRPSAPDTWYKSVASCGYVEFFIAPLAGQVATANDVSEILKFLQLDEPELFLELERDAFASDDDDARNVRVAAYTERGLCERDASGELVGLIPELVHRVALHRNWNITYITMSYPEAQRALAEGKVDFVGAMTRTPERERLYDFSRCQMGPLNYALMARFDTKLKANDPETWKESRIGIMRGSKSALGLDAMLKERGIYWNARRYSNLVDAEAALRRGEIDAVLTLPNSGNRDLQPLITLPTEICYFASSRMKPWVGEDFDAQIEQFLRYDNHWMHKLVHRHLRGYTKLSLSVPELDFVRNSAGKRFTVSFDGELPPLVSVDPGDGRVEGFYKELFDRIGKASGLKFELLPPGSAADLLVCATKAARPELERNTSPDWIKAPACWVCRRRADKSGAGVIAVCADDDAAIESVRKAGYQTLVCPGRDAAYDAVRQGRAEKMVDRLSVARYRLDELKEYPDLTMLKIDIDNFAFPVAIQVAASIDSRFKDIVDKASDCLTASDLDTMVFETIGNLRSATVEVSTLVYSILGMLAVAAIILWFVHREAKLAHSMNQAKTTFLNSMSHDIRTPMNAILGFTNMARNCLGDPERARECLAKIDVAGNHLLQLVNEVLDISRVESGTVDIVTAQFDLVKYLESLRDMFGVTAAKRGLEVKIDGSGIRDRSVLCDGKRFDQIVVNIVGNAVKYTREGWVKVSGAEGEVRNGSATYTFVIEDTGVGMSKEFVKRIYEPFVRDKSARSSGVEGTGLGMSIVRRMVDLCGGTIAIDSEVGRGTKVTLEFEFPIATLKSGKSAAYAVDDVQKQKTLALRGVLLVEDNEFNREIARFVLEGLGLVVEECVNGAEAVEKLRQSGPGTYSWVLMDIQMPVMNGYEAAREIRKFNPKIPIIAMTANAFAEDRAAALAAGMNEHMAKPIKAERIKETLLNFI